MHHKALISALDEKRLRDAIANAESKSTGQLRIFISSQKAPDPLATGTKHFQRLGMHKTKHRNAILLFIAPHSHTFAIVGDTAIHEKCGPAFWDTLRDEMTAHLKERRYTDALVQAATKAGELLAIHFPADGIHPNEQPDDILKD